MKLSKKSRAVLHTSMGVMTLELLVDKAPRTVENFVKLAHKGFYDGTTFHRVLKGFMVQGGCPKGDGTGGPGYTIGPEFNDTPHVRGTVSMARSNDPHSGGSQFFIVHGEARYLDNKYSAFARVLEDGGSLEVLDKIAAAPVFENRWKELSQPRDAIYINRIELEGVEFEADEGARSAPPAAAPARTQAAAEADEDEDEDEAEGEAEDEDAEVQDGGDEPADDDSEAVAEAEAPAKPRRKPARGSGGKDSGGKSGAKASGRSGDKSGGAKAAGKSKSGAAKKKSGSRSRAGRDD